MTEKENFLMVLKGQQPEWIPRYTYGPDPEGGHAAIAHVGVGFLMGYRRSPYPEKDIWGVNYIPVKEAGGGKLPEPGNFILHDIRKWRDVIKAPDLTGVDWETVAKHDMEKLNVDRNETAVTFGLGGSFFQTLVSFMGFNEGLCALYEEPEEVLALNEYLCDFYYTVAKKCMHYYKPDFAHIADDNATWLNPFFSHDMYRELFKPYQAKIASVATDMGLAIDMHDCGRCEDLIDDWREFGVVLWEPAQVCNDLDAIKKKYGNSLVITGGFDLSGALLDEDVSEETVKEAVYKTIDRLAPGGGYVFSGNFLGAVDDEKTKRKNKWIRDAAVTYGRAFYKK